MGSATACSRRSSCSPCRTCTRRSSPPARSATGSTSCSCWSSGASCTGPASEVLPMADVSLTRKSARELARLIRTGEASPREVLEAHLAVIDALNPKLNAIVTLAVDQAREAARAAEAAVEKGAPLGALHGLPVAIKD